MCCLASVIRSPITRIMRVGSTSWVAGSSVGSGSLAGWKPCISACSGRGASGASTSAWPSVLWAVPLSMAARTSRSTMRPAGPDPSIRERSRSFSSARRLTIGEARKWPSVRPSACGCPADSPSSAASSSSGASVSVAVWARASPPPSSPPSSSSASAPPPPAARSGTSSASSSRVTLSVSISAIASPSETSSPSLLSHLTRVPSSIASPILGMITSGILLLLHVKHPTGRVGHLLLAREGRELQVARVRRRDLRPAHPLDRGVQIVEGPVLDNRRDLARDPEPPPLLLDRHRPMRLLDRLDYGVLVERPDRAQVYDLRANVVFLFQGARHPQTQVDLPPVGDERHVRALARCARLAEGDSVVAFLYLALRPVEGAGLQEDHRVGVPYGRQHQALDVVGRDGGDHLEPREVPVHVLQRVGVLRGKLHAAA